MTLGELKRLVGDKPFVWMYSNGRIEHIGLIIDCVSYDLTCIDDIDVPGSAPLLGTDDEEIKSCIVLDWFEESEKFCVCIGAPARTCPEHGINSTIAA